MADDGICHGLRELRESLPEASSDESMETAARAFLRRVVEATLKACARGDFPASKDADPRQCPNCGGVAASLSSPYCGPQCREEASLVRQFRRAILKGTILEAEAQVTHAGLFWRHFGGGYPLRIQQVPERTWNQIFKRDEGKCQICGAPATRFEHAKTACNRPINLRCVCDACCTVREFGDERFLADIETDLETIAVRLASPHAICPCDDDEAWDWRSFVAERKRI